MYAIAPHLVSIIGDNMKVLAEEMKYRGFDTLLDLLPNILAGFKNIEQLRSIYDYLSRLPESTSGSREYKPLHHSISISSFESTQSK